MDLSGSFGNKDGVEQDIPKPKKAGDSSAVKLNVATCQFPVGGDIKANLAYILEQIKYAKQHNAQVVHFSEGALSGYFGVTSDTCHGFDWDLLVESTRKVMSLAKELELWVILGSSHRLSGDNKPYNSLYIINDSGEIVERYDKMFCTGNVSEDDGDLKFYSPGNHFCVFEIDGVKCGVLICHDFRYIELYRVYYKRGVRLMFHSYHNAAFTTEKLKEFDNIWAKLVPATMQTYAAGNHMWISANNSSKPNSSWPSFFVNPEGVITGQLENDKPGVLISTVDTSADFYDASAAWRDRAIEGVYHSGTLVEDERSDCRTSL